MATIRYTRADVDAQIARIKTLSVGGLTWSPRIREQEVSGYFRVQVDHGEHQCHGQVRATLAHGSSNSASIRKALRCDVYSLTDRNKFSEKEYQNLVSFVERSLAAVADVGDQEQIRRVKMLTGVDEHNRYRAYTALRKLGLTREEVLEHVHIADRGVVHINGSFVMTANYDHKLVSNDQVIGDVEAIREMFAHKLTRFTTLREAKFEADLRQVAQTRKYAVKASAINFLFEKGGYSDEKQPFLRDYIAYVQSNLKLVEFGTNDLRSLYNEAQSTTDNFTRLGDPSLYLEFIEPAIAGKLELI